MTKFPNHVHFFAKDATAGRTAVHHAIEEKNFGMLRVLLFDYQANVNAQRWDENTPLHIAAGRGLLDMSAMLIAAGADFSIPNHENETPLDTAAPEVTNFLSSRYYTTFIRNYLTCQI